MLWQNCGNEFYLVTIFFNEEQCHLEIPVSSLKIVQPEASERSTLPRHVSDCDQSFT